MTKEDFQKEIGKRHTKARAEKGKSINGLANRAEVSRTTLKNIELGVINPNNYTLKKVLNALDISMAEFFSGL